MKTVAVMTRDVVGSRMAGPGIRAYHTALELAKYFPTLLVARFVDFTPAPGVTYLDFGSPEAARAIREADVVVSQPIREALARPSAKRRRVFDLFDPVIAELDELYGARPTVRQRLHRRVELRRLERALKTGDALIAATPAQKSFYQELEPSSKSKTWIDMGFGIESHRPAARSVPDLMRGDPRPVITWGGGVWQWLDPETAIRAVIQLNAEGCGCRLLFLGSSRPLEASVGAARGRLDALVAEAGDAVIWNAGWVPYSERARWLLASRGAIMLHGPTEEARLSIRTRLFDAIWCALPVIATEGGYAAELVAAEGLGIVTKASDAGSVAAAIRRLIEDDAFHARAVSNLVRVRPRYTWANVVRPLVETIAAWR
jgi:glycosyltransferase involved in cell wall biosynthesis